MQSTVQSAFRPHYTLCSPVVSTGRIIQYFVNSLGRDAASCSDLMSYLLFTAKYTRDLIALGYHDASQRIDEIESYLYSSDGGDDDNVVDSAVGPVKPRSVTSISKRNSNFSKERG